MSNRLEQEFPEVTWSAMPPVGPGGVPPEVMREYLRRGRQLRSQAIRDGVRAGGAAAARGLVSLATFLRCTGQALARRRHLRDCWAGSPHCT
jgi:hypothetical protein